MAIRKIKIEDLNEEIETLSPELARFVIGGEASYTPTQCGSCEEDDCAPPYDDESMQYRS
jgi:hypothetical protein